ncbi:hypothetical protein [Mesorhizobium sp. 131-3-5]|uniref:hypothetical protein n=1 Tax=Mesorhizobium sp. 131-3-5 TaxID=2744520 RepID=UPI00406D4640
MSVPSAPLAQSRHHELADRADFFVDLLAENSAVTKAVSRTIMIQKENARTETQLAIARAMIRAGKQF